MPKKQPKYKSTVFAEDVEKEGVDNYTWKNIGKVFGVYCTLPKDKRTYENLYSRMAPGERKLYDWSIVKAEMAASDWFALALESDRAAYSEVAKEVGRAKAPNLGLAIDILNTELEQFRRSQLQRAIETPGAPSLLIQDMGHLKAAVKTAQELAATNEDGTPKAGTGNEELGKAVARQTDMVAGIMRMLLGGRGQPSPLRVEGVETDDILAVLEGED